MKTKLPDVPYTAKSKICRSSDGELVVGVEVRIKAPSRIAALLDEGGDGRHLIQSACLCENMGRDPLNDVPSRVRSWKKAKTSPGKDALLIEAVKEGLDSEIRVLITTNQWHAVGVLCGKLGITSGQWYLGSAAYNASLAEMEITRMLEVIPVCD